MSTRYSVKRKQTSWLSRCDMASTPVRDLGAIIVLPGSSSRLGKTSASPICPFPWPGGTARHHCGGYSIRAARFPYESHELLATWPLRQTRSAVLVGGGLVEGRWAGSGGIWEIQWRCVPRCTQRHSFSSFLDLRMDSIRSSRPQTLLSSRSQGKSEQGE